MFCAAISRSGRPLATGVDEVTGVLRRHHAGDVSGQEAEPVFLATQALLHRTPESRREQVPARDDAGRLMVSWLRLDNRDDLGRALGWEHARVRDATDPDLVLAAYARWGSDCPDRLEGDFAFVIVDADRRTCFGARDASGIRPFYFAVTDHLVAAATTPAMLLPFASDGLDVTVRPEWVARYVHGVSMTWDETPFQGIAKLPPGHSLRYDADGVTVRRWHEYRDDPPWEDTRADHWLEAYRDRLHEAVRCRTRGEGPMGVETSGGLDSSSVLALVAALAPHRLADLHGFGHAHAELEPEYILETSRVLKVPLTHVMCGPMASSGSVGWETLGHPVEHANATSYTPFYELARTLGVGTLHSGHGGDELVTNPGHLALAELVDRRAFGTLLRTLPQPRHRRPAWVARELWRQSRAGSERPGTTSALTGPMLERLRWTPLRAGVVEDAGIRDITERQARFDAPYRRVNDFALQGRLLPFVSTRTSECSVVAAAYGVDYRWPLLDRRLVQQWLSTPSVWKYAEGTGRYLHRRAVSDVVPAKVAWKPSKQMFVTDPDPLPLLVHTADPLHPLLAELVDEGRWQEPADMAGRPPSTGVHQRPWQRVAQLNSWLRSAT